MREMDVMIEALENKRKKMNTEIKDLKRKREEMTKHDDEAQEGARDKRRHLEGLESVMLGWGSAEQAVTEEWESS